MDRILISLSSFSRSTTVAHDAALAIVNPEQLRPRFPLEDCSNGAPCDRAYTGAIPLQPTTRGILC